MPVDFEWDQSKADTNRSKHGITFDEASTVFGDPLSVAIADPDHSGFREARYLLLGRSFRGRLLVVSHAERGGIIRLISARRADRQEARVYEEGS